MTDYSGNPNVGIFDIEVTEIPDIVPPTLLSGEVDLNVGTLTIFASETLDTIPLETNVDMAKIRLQKTPHGFIEIAGADLDPIETDVIVFDPYRVAAGKCTPKLCNSRRRWYEA